MRAVFRLRAIPGLGRGALLRAGLARSVQSLRPVAVEDMMENADYVGRESRDVREPTARERPRVVDLPMFMDPGELLSGDMLNALGAAAVDLDEPGIDRMNGEVVAHVPAVVAPVPDRVSCGDCPLDLFPDRLEPLIVLSHRIAVPSRCGRDRDDAALSRIRVCQCVLALPNGRIPFVGRPSFPSSIFSHVPRNPSTSSSIWLRSLNALIVAFNASSPRMYLVQSA